MRHLIWSWWALLLGFAAEVTYVVTGGLLHVVLGLCVVLYSAFLLITWDRSA